jgi:broad specificity phosphatase PhoE
MPVIHLIRHAQASFGSESYDALSELGHRQSALLDAALERRGIRADRVMAGTLRRQTDTALACTASAPGTLLEDARWDEYDAAGVLTAHGEIPDGSPERTDLGVPAGLSSREFQGLLDGGLERWIEAGDASPCAETWPAFRARALGALGDLAADLGSGERALVFTSGGVVAAIGAALIGAPDSTFIPLNRVSVNSGVTKLMSGGGGIRLVTFNDHSHLEHDRELTTFR